MSDFWYDHVDSFDVDEFSSPSSGMDQFFEDGDSSSDHNERHATSNVEQKIASSEGSCDRVKVAHPDELDGFVRVSNSDELIRLSEQDLWSLEEDEDGDFYIERLYDEDGDPLEV